MAQIGFYDEDYIPKPYYRELKRPQALLKEDSDEAIEDLQAKLIGNWVLTKHQPANKQAFLFCRYIPPEYTYYYSISVCYDTFLHPDTTYYYIVTPRRVLCWNLATKKIELEEVIKDEVES